MLDDTGHNCGIAAVFVRGNLKKYEPYYPKFENGNGADKHDAMLLMYKLLLNLQNRGQLSAGITSFCPDRDQLLKTYRELKEGDKVIGGHVRVRVVKNKIAPPFREAEFDILHNEGISKTGDVLDLAVQHEIVGKSGAWFDYADGKIGQGREATKTYLKENSKVLAEIEKKVRTKVQEEDV